MKASIGFVLKAWLLPASAIAWIGYAEPASAQQPTTHRSSVQAITPPGAPRRLSELGTSEQGAIRLVAEAQPKSAVQQQLEALYKKEGREMPAMNISDLPDGEFQAPPLPPQNAYPQSALPQNAFPQTGARRAPEPEKSQNWLQRLFSGSQDPGTTQQRKTSTKPRTGLRSATSFGRHTGRRGRGAAPSNLPQAPREPAVEDLGPQYPMGAPAARANPAVAAPRQLPSFGVPVNSGVVPAPEPLPISDANEQPAFVQSPAAPAAPQQPLLSQEDDTPRLDLSESDSDDDEDLDDLFKDAVPATPSVAESAPTAPAQEESPFSGLKLQTPDADDTPELKPVPDNEPKFAERDPQEEKYQILANSPEMTGFKGFCPVRLTNDRELVVALPAYEAEFESQIYRFSSAEAKAEFEKTPERYAPVSGGTDIVLFQEEEVTRLGSLDHAAWYKGRLYLFSTLETMEAFMAKPKEYVELDRPIAPAIITPAGKPAEDFGFEDSLELPAPKAENKPAEKPPTETFAAEDLPRLDLGLEEPVEEDDEALDESNPFFAPELTAPETKKPAPKSFELEDEEANVIDSKEWKPAAKPTTKPATAKPATTKRTSTKPAAAKPTPTTTKKTTSRWTPTTKPRTTASTSK